MKIVHELYGKHPQITGTAHAYWPAVDQPLEWCGCRVEVLICDVRTDESSPFITGESIYIEGDGEAVVAALEGALGVVRASIDLKRKHFTGKVPASAE